MENTWQLESLSIYRSYDKKFPLAGNIKFNNGQQLQFAMNLDGEKCAKLIAILKDEVVDSAKQLSEMMIQSVPHLVQPEEIKQIEPTEPEL